MNEAKPESTLQLMSGRQFFISAVLAFLLSMFFNGANSDLTNTPLGAYAGMVIGLAVGLIGVSSLVAAVLTVPFWLISKKPVKRAFTAIYWIMFSLGVVSQLAQLAI